MTKTIQELIKEWLYSHSASRDGEVNNPPIILPFHLCPICGLPSGTSSRICNKHISFLYDANGNLIDYQDIKILSPIVIAPFKERVK